MKYKLKIEKNFTDKETNESYKTGDEKVFSEKRGKELLNDSRKLVSLVKELKENSKTNTNKDKTTTAKKDADSTNDEENNSINANSESENTNINE